MPQSKTISKGANGRGSIRKRTVMRNGKSYTYWESRITIGFDPITGKQKQKTYTGKTQKEVREKLNQAAYELDNQLFVDPAKTTVQEWMETWQKEYSGGVKPSTALLYANTIRLYILPNLGHLKLSDVQCQTIQRFYNFLLHPSNDETDGLSAKTVKNVHGVLHKAMQQAVKNGLLRTNPCEGCTLPKITKREITPLTEDQLKRFLALLPGHPHEYYYQIAVFTGIREGELLGLPWENVDLEKGIVHVKQQLQCEQKKGGQKKIVPPKNGKNRSITIAPSVVRLFEQQRLRQNLQKEKLGSAWQDTGMVFTNPTGGYLSNRTVYDCFKRLVKKIGVPSARVHDLRHTYATLSIQSGDDIKTVQENLGHATAAFTLDVYGHVSDAMKKKSADRMEQTIQAISA